MFLEFLYGSVQPLSCFGNFVQQREGGYSHRGPLDNRVICMEGGAGNSWRSEIAFVILLGNRREGRPYLLPLCLRESVISRIIAHSDPLQETHDGVSLSAIGRAIGLPFPRVATGERPRAGGFPIAAVPAQRKSERQMLGHCQIAHDRVEAIIKIFVIRI